MVGDPAPTDAGVRLKDLCEISGVRDNHLFGVGLVVGLSGTGDKNPATVRMLRQMLATKHLSFDDADLSSKNVAMVTVTADLPAFARAGSRLYTTVSVAGDATSLRGGMLLQTPLTGADERIYAVAQGAVSVGGFGAASPGLPAPGVEHRNIETDAALSQGALVEREVPGDPALRRPPAPDPARVRLHHRQPRRALPGRDLRPGARHRRGRQHDHPRLRHRAERWRAGRHHRQAAAAARRRRTSRRAW